MELRRRTPFVEYNRQYPSPKRATTAPATPINVPVMPKMTHDTSVGAEAAAIACEAELCAPVVLPLVFRPRLWMPPTSCRNHHPDIPQVPTHGGPGDDERVYTHFNCNHARVYHELFTWQIGGQAQLHSNGSGAGGFGSESLRQRARKRRIRENDRRTNCAIPEEIMALDVTDSRGRSKRRFVEEAGSVTVCMGMLGQTVAPQARLGRVRI